MNLINKTITMDQTTFAPIVRLTIEFPIEIIQDGVALMGENEVKMILGTELFNLMKP